MQLISELEKREKDDLLISKEEEMKKKSARRCEKEKYSKNVRRNKKRFEKGQGWSLKNNILMHER